MLPHRWISTQTTYPIQKLHLWSWKHFHWLKFFINATLFIIYCSIVIHNIHLYASFDQLLFIIHIDIHILLLQLNSASLIHTNNFTHILKPTSTTCRPMHFHKITLKFLYKVSSHLALIAYEVSFHLASLASIAYFKCVSMLMFQLLQTILYLVFLHNWGSQVHLRNRIWFYTFHGWA